MESHQSGAKVLEYGLLLKYLLLLKHRPTWSFRQSFPEKEQENVLSSFKMSKDSDPKLASPGFPTEHCMGSESGRRLTVYLLRSLVCLSLAFEKVKTTAYSFRVREI